MEVVGENGEFLSTFTLCHIQRWNFCFDSSAKGQQNAITLSLIDITAIAWFIKTLRNMFLLFYFQAVKFQLPNCEPFWHCQRWNFKVQLQAHPRTQATCSLLLVWHCFLIPVMSIINVSSQHRPSLYNMVSTVSMRSYRKKYFIYQFTYCNSMYICWSLQLFSSCHHTTHFSHSPPFYMPIH